jgi:plasmid stabilization system protein ParE
MTTPKKSSPHHEPLAIFTAGTDPLAFGPPALVRLPAELAGAKLELPVYEPKAAEALLDAWHPRLIAISPDRLDFPRVDVDGASRALFTAYALTQVPPMLAIYEAEAKAGSFNLPNLDALRDATMILVHTYYKANAAQALKTSAKVPAELDSQSAEVEARMQKVCEDFFPDDPVIAALRPGIGYVDRAYDLLGYADKYEEQAAVLAGHPQYRAADKDQARKLAGRILAEMDKDMNPAQRQAFDLLRRAWTLVKPIYFEVQQVGLAALRYDPARDERFPSLYTAGRKSPTRKKGSKSQADAVTPANAPNAPQVDAKAETK